MSDLNLEKKVWWGYAEHDLRELLNEAQTLIDDTADWKNRFHDYSFIVFPAAKAYEGFLKKVFLDMNLISEKQYFGKRFRIGKALNPSLKSKFRNRISVYDKLIKFCGETELADQMWDTWKSCRNLLFHWFPGEKNKISYDQAVERVEKIIDTFDLVFNECKLNNK